MASNFMLEWTDRKGGYHCEHGSFNLAKRLETIRANASLWLLDSEGRKKDKVGGCDPNDGRADDKRLKWLWWYEKDVA